MSKLIIFNFSKLNFKKNRLHVTATNYMRRHFKKKEEKNIFIYKGKDLCSGST